jgi:hypothetical protein
VCGAPEGALDHVDAGAGLGLVEGITHFEVTSIDLDIDMQIL